VSRKVLVVVSSHSEFPGTRRSTGYWVGEVSHFAEVVEAAGFELDVASPRGGEPPIDPKSVSGFQSLDGGHAAYQRNPELQRKLRATLTPEQVDAEAYAAIFFAGGHGTMWDFPEHERLGALAAQIYESGNVVSAVCHGVTGLLGAKLSDGNYLVAGHAVTGFANIEERLMGLGSKVPFLTESELRKRGARYERGLPFLSHVVVSGRLVTGQNPGSTKGVAREVAALLAH
jgi:putative intracellular protease/amidase